MGKSEAKPGQRQNNAATRSNLALGLGSITQALKRNQAFFILFAVAIALRIITLDAKGLWLDEAYSVHLAGQGLSGLIAQLSLESTPPLYYLGLHFWINIFGSSEGAVRALSLVFSLGTMTVLYSLGRKFFSRSVAVAVAALAAFSPLQIYYAQETRMYSLLALLAAGLLYFTIGAAVGSAGQTVGAPAALRRQVMGMGLIGLLMLYTHTVALGFVAACFMVALYYARERKTRRLVLLSLAGMILAYLPWLLVLIRQVARQETVLQWFVPFWQGKPIWSHVFDSLSSFLFGPFPPYLAVQSAGGFLPILFILFAAILAWGLISHRKSLPLRACSLIAVLAFGFPLLYSRLFQPIYIPGRTDQYLQPVFLLLVGVGILSIAGRRILQTGVILLYGALSVWVLIPYYGNTDKNASRSYMEEVRKVAAPRDILIATGYTFAASEYYALKWNLPVTITSYPLSLQSHPGFFNPEAEGRRPEVLAQDANVLEKKLADLSAPANKGIILATPHGINEVLLRALSREFQVNDAAIGQSLHEALLRTPVRILVAEKKPAL